jgi:hypothetical protein
MTRSLGTDPPDIRAERRIKAPRKRRGQEEVARRRVRRLRKELRVEDQERTVSNAGPPHRVDIVVVPARRGYFHPLKPAEIRRAFEFFGPLAVYGIRSVEMRPLVQRSARGVPIARLQVPGKIVLFEQMHPPWNVRGLAGESIDRLRRAGATVKEGLGAARVDWTPQALKDFVLFEGLMHEIGHHLIQQHTGKRLVRVMRTANHEHRAAAFADACRRAWTNARPRP